MSKQKIILSAMGIGLTALFLIVVFGNSGQTPLPIYTAGDIDASLVDGSVDREREHFVLDFELVNQNGKMVTQDDYEDHIYVTDFFFTRCPSICPIMTNNMERLQEAFLGVADVKLLSVSVTPAMDSVPVLKEYALHNNVMDGKWNITTGDKKHIYNLARKSYFAAYDEGDGGLQDFIHTSQFVLVDKKRQIRGFYDGIDSLEIKRLIKDIHALRKEG